MVSFEQKVAGFKQKCSAKLRFFPTESNYGHHHFDQPGLDFDELGWKVDGLEAWGFVKIFLIPI